MKGWRGFLVGIGIMCVGCKIVNFQHIMEVQAPRTATTCLSSTPLLSAFAEATISNMIREYDGISLRPAHLQAVIADYFPFIKTIIVQDRLGKKTVTYGVHKPLIVCNDQFLLLENGVVVPKHYYRAQAFQTVPAFSMRQESSHVTMPERFAFVRLCGPDFFETFNVVWHSPTCVELQDRQRSDITFVIDEKNYERSDFLKKVNFIKQEVTHLNEGRKKPLLYRADLRFAGQMVLSVQKGGRV